MQFGSVALNVLIMLAYGIPGYLFIKTKFLKEDAIPAFSKLLLYVCQPCLMLYCLQQVTYSKELFLKMLLFLAMSTALQVLAVISLHFIFLKKSDQAKYRVAKVAPVFGNVGFFGTPLLEALLPGHPEALAYASMFIVSFNLLVWTLGAYFLTGNKQFVRPKKMILNPPFLSLIVALPLFFTGTTLPTMLSGPVTILAKFTTPLCMIIVGMRFATEKPSALFTEPTAYLSSSIKLIILPLIAFLCVNWLPIEYTMKATLFILFCCPSANVILSLSEISGSGQQPAANAVLISTILCMVTIPVLLLLLQFTPQ